MSDISLSKAVRSNLLSLQSTATMMAKTQDRLATGNKVNSALDNPTNFFTASSLNSRAGDLNALIDGMANGVKTLEAADNGLTSITKTLESMQSTLRQARQDKSFQTGTFEVTANSTLTVDGGQFALPQEIKLGTQTAGVNAELKTAATTAYRGPTGSATSATGAGARSVITNAGAGLGDNDIITVAGVDITLDEGVAASGVDDTELANQIAAALTADADTAGKYTVTVGTGGNAGKVIVETIDPNAAAATVAFGTGSVAAELGETTFNYSAITSSVTAGGQTIQTGSTFEEFVANLQAGAEAGGYTVTSNATTKDITLTNVAHGATAPTVTGINANQSAQAATSVVDLTGATSTAAQTMTIDGVSLTLATSAGEDAVGADIVAKIGANATLNAKYTATYDTTTNELTLTDKTTGANRSAATFSFTNLTTAPTDTTVTFTQGEDAVTGGAAQTLGIVGASTETVEAEKDTFSVTYDGKTANLSIGAVKGGIGSTANAIEVKDWQDATVAKINSDLKDAGITGVEAKFGTDGKLSIVATAQEAKSIAVSGTDANALFGTTTVSTGKAAVDGYSSSQPVDKFVEEINRSFAGKLRASNDNGKLRVENLSTAEMDVSFDADGAGVGTAVSSKIDGNSVRTSLANQFNELRDQLDKLSDDASFNGINLLRGDQLTITFNETGNSFMQVKASSSNGINSETLKVGNLDATAFDNDASIDDLLSNIKTALNSVRSQSSAFGSNLSIVQNRQDFTKSMITTLQTGAANLTLADMNEEAANLLALQTRQSLSSSTLSMASQADQSVLQLLR